MSATQTDTPNIRKLAELIYDTGHADRIMAALEVILRVGLADDLRAASAKEDEV